MDLTRQHGCAIRWKGRLDPTQIEVALLDIYINERDTIGGQSPHASWGDP